MRWAEPADADPSGTRRAPGSIDIALFGLACAVSAYVLFWPDPPGEVPFPYADKLVHAAVFLAVAWTGSRVGLPLRAFGIALVAYAIGSEVTQQTLLAERSGDWTDVIADLVGAGVAFTVARPRSPRTRKR